MSFTGIKTILISIGAGLLAAIGIFLKGRSSGKDSERLKQSNLSAKQSRRANEIDDTVRCGGAESARQRLRDAAKH